MGPPLSGKPAASSRSFAAVAARIDQGEKHRSPTRNTPQARAFRGTDAKEFPIAIPDKEIQQLAEHFSKQEVKSFRRAPPTRSWSCRRGLPAVEMLAYRASQRPDTTMTAALYGVKDEEIEAAGAFPLAKLARTGSSPK
jgi:hypothetical protein